MPSGTAFIIEPLDPAKHRREAFDCGVAALNDFLRTRARREMEADISASFVLVPKEKQEQIAGFYTLSSASILRTELPEALLKKLPRYNQMPATLLGRLARSLDFKGQGIGARLMMSAFPRRSWVETSCGIVGSGNGPEERGGASVLRELRLQAIER